MVMATKEESEKAKKELSGAVRGPMGGSPSTAFTSHRGCLQGDACTNAARMSECSICRLGGVVFCSRAAVVRFRFRCRFRETCSEQNDSRNAFARFA